MPKCGQVMMLLFCSYCLIGVGIGFFLRREISCSFLVGSISLIYNKTGKDTRNNAKEYTYLDMSISLSVAENCRRLSCRI